MGLKYIFAGILSIGGIALIIYGIAGIHDNAPIPGLCIGFGIVLSTCYWWDDIFG